MHQMLLIAVVVVGLRMTIFIISPYLFYDGAYNGVLFLIIAFLAGNDLRDDASGVRVLALKFLGLILVYYLSQFLIYWAAYTFYPDTFEAYVFEKVEKTVAAEMKIQEQLNRNVDARQIAEVIEADLRRGASIIGQLQTMSLKAGVWIPLSFLIAFLFNRER